MREEEWTNVYSVTSRTYTTHIMCTTNEEEFIHGVYEKEWNAVKWDTEEKKKRRKKNVYIWIRDCVFKYEEITKHSDFGRVYFSDKE